MLRTSLYFPQVACKEGRSGCQVLTDLTSPSEPVASKKNLFEAGEAWNQNPVSVAPSKESSSGKRYKFVVAGHGKYEKVSADSGSPSQKLPLYS
uniref:Uncharacterized protein n=1 Tax=Amphiprion percula TaxID=161767 RepID=A0A3P8RJH6_AMPPE